MMRRSLIGGMIVAVGVGLAGGMAWAQDGATASAAKPPAFDVVTIKPNLSGSQGSVWGASSTGYNGRNIPLAYVILSAYLGVPATPVDRLSGAPAWALNDHYDIIGKVDEATIEAMKGMKQAQKIALEAPMLRTMLESRCKLVAHTVPIEVQGYALVVSKHGLKMREADPSEPKPEHAIRFENNPWMMVPQIGPDGKQTGVSYLQITMAELTGFIGTAVPVVDRTGLTGRYDVVLPLLDAGPSAGPDGAAPGPRPDVAHMLDWDAVGLEMRPIKVPVTGVMVDHMEKPTEN